MSHPTVPSDHPCPGHDSQRRDPQRVPCRRCRNVVSIDETRCLRVDGAFVRLCRLCQMVCPSCRTAALRDGLIWDGSLNRYLSVCGCCGWWERPADAAPALARRVEELEAALTDLRERAAKLASQTEPSASPRSGYYSFGRAELATAIRALPLEEMKKQGLK